MFGFRRFKRSQREIIINAEKLETRVAVVGNGRLEEFQIEHAAQERVVGSIYKGIVQNLEPDLQAAFIDIGMKKNAFVHYWDMLPDDDARLDEEEDGHGHRGFSRRKRISHGDIARRFPAGSEIVVQVTKGAIGTKGPRVTAALSIPGRFLVFMPGCRLRGISRKVEEGRERERMKKILRRLPLPDEIGLIMRTAGVGARKTSFVRDLRSLIDMWQRIQQGITEKQAPCCVHQEPGLIERMVRDWLTEEVDRIVLDSREEFDRLRDAVAGVSRRARSRIQLYEGDLPIFEHFDVERQIEEVFRRRVALKSGGHIVFDETEALIAIDVNTGRHKTQGTHEDTILEVNLEAVEEIARHLRLRNLGGLIVIDFIDMKQRRHHNAVYRALKAALSKDRARTNVLAISQLGLLEMTRQRVEESILSLMNVDCPYCRGSGHVRSPFGISVQIQRQLMALIRRLSRTRESVRLQVIVHPRVLERLRTEDEDVLLEMQSEFKCELGFKSDSNRHVEDFAIVDAGTGEVLCSTAESGGAPKREQPEPRSM